MQGLQRIEGTRIVSVFDVNRDNAVQAAESTGAQVMDTAEQVLDPDQIDAVYICTPQFARGDLEEQAAQRGIHLFVEKPLGLDMEEVRRKEQSFWMRALSILLATVSATSIRCSRPKLICKVSSRI